MLSRITQDIKIHEFYKSYRIYGEIHYTGFLLSFSSFLISSPVCALHCQPDLPSILVGKGCGSIRHPKLCAHLLITFSFACTDQIELIKVPLC